MATVTYGWRALLDSFLVNTRTEVAGDQANAAITALHDGSGFFTAWDQPTKNFVDGSMIGSDSTSAHEITCQPPSVRDSLAPSA